MTANKLKKRIEKLEETIHPKPQRKWKVIYQKGNETLDEALLRAGISPENRDEFNCWFVQIVNPPARDPISGEILN